VLAGYLTGSAIVIGTGQLGKILAIPTPGERWWQKLGEAAANLDETNLGALLIGTATVLTVVGLLHWMPRVPGILLAIASATALVALFGWQGHVPVIGHVPSGIPVPALPRLSLPDVVDLLGAGASVALLAFAGSMLTASALA
jgi:SulP family sulfate permease